MKKERILSEMFEQAREEARKIPVGEVKSLLESGQTSPLASNPSYRPRRITRLFNPLKFFIMITPIILITAGLLNWNADRNVQVEQPEQIKAEQTNQPVGITKNEAVRIQPQPAGRPTVPESAPKPDFNSGVPVEAAQPVQKDTILAGIILDLSKEELTRLGFMFDDEGYYYLNQLPDGSKMNCWSYKGQYGGSFGFGSGGFVNQSNKAELGKLDFYPVLRSNLKGENLNAIWQLGAKVDDYFELMNDTLVPVRFSSIRLGGYPMQDQLVWFKVSKEFYARLSGEQADRSRRVFLTAAELKKSGNTQNLVAYSYSGIVNPAHVIKLKADVLTCMGFKISDKLIEYQYQHPRANWKFWIDSLGSVGSSNLSFVGPGKLFRNLGQFLVVYGITDTWGNYSVGYNPQSLNHGQPAELVSFINLSLPIQIDEENIPPRAKEAIFWVYPNEKFFSCLPPEIADPMRKEFNYQLKKMNPDSSPVMGGSIGIGGSNSQKDTTSVDEEPVPCVYFTNLCETIPGLDYINLYPNPASDKINIDLVLLTARKIRFRVFDLGGRVISDEGAVENYSTGGRFTHQVEVSSLQKGFYLLVLTDEEGARVTRRFIKE